METDWSGNYFFCRYVCREGAIQRAHQFLPTMNPEKVKTDDLSNSMGASISSSGRGNCCPFPTDIFQCAFNFALNGPVVFLALISEEISAVVCNSYLVKCHSNRMTGRIILPRVPAEPSLLNLRYAGQVSACVYSRHFGFQTWVLLHQTIF